ncbi:hypothetical protein [Marinisporobacter balticus]|uniref:Uncharacterized protein n=1 Tax=Marinisporobacter balticus TaxID=2018667 RepID=A0A4R2KFN7_9FIRM|nr:hypothetical protein [Marinisporobacter balticus]TCO71047.1 hypothetical protein EV214_12335 [Marinisporobacter balticus]
MNHYDQIQWILYKKGVLSIEASEKMEDHLSMCDQCLEIFLSLIDEEEIKSAHQMISPDFTASIIHEANTIKNDFMKRKYKPEHKNLFIYYTAAAMVTLVLMGSGFFYTLVNTVPSITQSAVSQEHFMQTNRITNFSEKVVNKTSDFINHFEVCDQRRN